ncbi:AsmA family protein [Vibrio fluminensis]|uniref:AsmA family protein n=1 Tax=Vibrio fluminensis TaxID=2783614 RepID=UPI0018875E05|nr:AsmA family protein [Vibrio fluminensis]
MIKRLGYLFLLLAVLCIGAIVALYATMRSQYATSVVNYLLNSRHSDIQVKQVSYTPPLQLTLEGITFASDETLYLPKAELWFSRALPNTTSLKLDTLVIEGANLSQHQAKDLTTLLSLTKQFTTKQLSIKHSDLAWGDFSARNVDVQIEQPVWAKGKTLPYGAIQFASEQLYYQGQAFNHFLIDLNYQAQDSTVYGASFEWNGAKISGQAEQYPQGWSLINITLEGLNIKSSDNELNWLKQITSSGWIRDINSLDILKSNLNYRGMEWLNLDLSVENVRPSVSIWQQKEGYLSFNADTLNYQGEQFVEPSATLYFTPHSIEIAELDTNWQQGRVQLQGQFRPNEVSLKNLAISGTKWLDVNGTKLAALSHWFDNIDEVSVEQLEINNAQLIQIANKPFWQVSGLNIEGEKLRLKQNNNFGLWQGSLQISANSASYAQYLSTQAIVEMSNQEKVWRLERLFLPLESGYIEATGKWDRQQLSAPWQMELTVDGMPLQHQFRGAQPPLEVEGIVDLHAQINGLAGDYSMLAHSLTGDITATLRDSHIEIANTEMTKVESRKKSSKIQENSQFSRNFHVGKLMITADRGRIALSSQEASRGTQLAGNIDLARPELATILLQVEDKCQRLQADLTSKAYHISDICPELNAQQSSRESSNSL